MEKDSINIPTGRRSSEIKRPTGPHHTDDFNKQPSTNPHLNTRNEPPNQLRHAEEHLSSIFLGQKDHHLRMKETIRIFLEKQEREDYNLPHLDRLLLPFLQAQVTESIATATHQTPDPQLWEANTIEHQQNQLNSLSQITKTINDIRRVPSKYWEMSSKIINEPIYQTILRYICNYAIAQFPTKEDLANEIERYSSTYIELPLLTFVAATLYAQPSRTISIHAVIRKIIISSPIATTQRSLNGYITKTGELFIQQSWAESHNVPPIEQNGLQHTKLMRALKEQIAAQVTAKDNHWSNHSIDARVSQT